MLRLYGFRGCSSMMSNFLVAYAPACNPRSREGLMSWVCLFLGVAGAAFDSRLVRDKGDFPETPILSLNQGIFLTSY